jgi:hypothetical protein
MSAQVTTHPGTDRVSKWVERDRIRTRRAINDRFTMRSTWWEMIPKRKAMSFSASVFHTGYFLFTNCSPCAVYITIREHTGGHSARVLAREPYEHGALTTQSWKFYTCSKKHMVMTCSDRTREYWYFNEHLATMWNGEHREHSLCSKSSGQEKPGSWSRCSKAHN